MTQGCGGDADLVSDWGVHTKQREGGTTAPAIRLLPRSMHYLQKPSQRELHIVKKLGHRDGSRKVPAGVRV